MDTDTDLADDMLNGVPEIAAFTKQPERRVYVLLNRGILPGWKYGNIWHSLKSSIRADIERRQRGDVA
jgi:hypothetical protein